MTLSPTFLHIVCNNIIITFLGDENRSNIMVSYSNQMNICVTNKKKLSFQFIPVSILAKVCCSEAVVYKVELLLPLPGEPCNPLYLALQVLCAHLTLLLLYNTKLLEISFII